jgi:hypothetical protein
LPERHSRSVGLAKRSMVQVGQWFGIYNWEGRLFWSVSAAVLCVLLVMPQKNTGSLMCFAQKQSDGFLGGGKKKEGISLSVHQSSDRVSRVSRVYV